VAARHRVRAAAEERVDAGTVYVSRDYHRTPGDAAFAGIFAGPSPATPYGGFTIAPTGTGGWW
jgi:hypothetical protein